MRSLSGASLAVAAMLALGTVASTAGCGKVSELKAKKNFKAGNQAYAAQDYKKAAELYEETVKADPNMGVAYFFLANSYDNQFKSSRKGEPDNDAMIQKAVENYGKAAEKLAQSPDTNDKLYAKRSLEFLVAAYGPDKLNDPAKAEPMVQKMIQLEPGEPTNYFQLAKIYEDAGAYPEAEQMLIKAKEVKPNDPAVYSTLAAFYNRQNQFEKTIAALEEGASKEPNNPVGYYTISAYYWDNGQRNFRLNEAQKRENIAKGLVAVNRALEIKPDYTEALVNKGLLLRLQANLEKDPKKQQDLLKEAVALRDKAEEIRKAKTAGTAK
jgi:tetratricopeptide (TPR) repeat protein